MNKFKKLSAERYEVDSFLYFEIACIFLVSMDDAMHFQELPRGSRPKTVDP